jgi:hypothetical protein
LSTFLGAASSAFEVTPQYVVLHYLYPYLASLRKKTDTWSKLEYKVVKDFTNWVDTWHFRLDPKQFPNFMQGVKKMAGGLPFPTSKNLTTADSGIYQNIPYTPMLRPERGVDVLLVLDNGEDMVLGSKCVCVCMCVLQPLFMWVGLDPM